MASIHKIFPFGFGNDPYSSFSLFIIAEGFQAAEKRLFMDSCHTLINKIFDTHPFGLAKIHPQWISVYAHFEASNQPGPSTSGSPNNRTLLDSSLNSSTTTISLNHSKLATLIEGLTVFDGEAEEALSEIVKKEQVNRGITGNLVLVLLPQTTSAQGAEAEHMPGTDEYHFTAVTQNGEWHQVVLRSIASMLGLADEFELEGATHLSPDDEAKAKFQGATPNLYFFDTPPTGTPKNELPWFGLLTKLQQSSPVLVHPHPGSADTPDRTIQANLFSADRIELWEGGGGFRKKVYRTASDCILRRKIGDTSLPVRDKIVPFCPVCSKIIGNIVKRN